MRHSSRSRTIVSLISVALLLLWGLPGYGVSIIAPRPDSQVKGVVPIAVMPGKGEDGFAYAVLRVDNMRHSISNVQPLHFEVNTADLANGPHVLQIELSDLAGLMASSKAVRIIVANPVPDRLGTVPPVTVPEVAPAPSAPAPLPVAPIQAAASRPGRGDALTVVMDGKPLQLAVKPVVEKGRALVLLRPLIEAMGGQLDWDPVKKLAIAIVDGRRYDFTTGDSAVMVNGKRTPIDRPPVILAGRTVIPITIWRDVFGGALQYDGVYGCITLDSLPEEMMPGSAIASN